MLALSAALAVATTGGCAALRPSEPSPTAGERMPGPASVWLTSEPAVPASPVDVVMTSPDEPAIRLAHTFVAGAPLRGAFATSEGRYTLAALGGACDLPIRLAPGEAVDVRLAIRPDGACSFEVVQGGPMDDPAMQKTEDAVLVTNGGAGDATPRIEPTPSR